MGAQTSTNSWWLYIHTIRWRARHGFVQHRYYWICRMASPWKHRILKVFGLSNIFLWPMTQVFSWHHNKKWLPVELEWCFSHGCKVHHRTSPHGYPFLCYWNERINARCCNCSGTSIHNTSFESKALVQPGTCTGKLKEKEQKTQIYRLFSSSFVKAICYMRASFPQGIVPFVFANEYGLHPDTLSTG